MPAPSPVTRSYLRRLSHPRLREPFCYEHNIYGAADLSDQRRFIFCQIQFLRGRAADSCRAGRWDRRTSFGERDWVVLGDIVDVNSDKALDGALSTAFRIGLEQSRFVNVVPDGQVQLAAVWKEVDPRSAAYRVQASVTILADGTPVGTLRSQSLALQFPSGTPIPIVVGAAVLLAALLLLAAWSVRRRAGRRSRLVARNLLDRRLTGLR